VVTGAEVDCVDGGRYHLLFLGFFLFYFYFISFIYCGI
jgi:hypothetical protein